MSDKITGALGILFYVGIIGLGAYQLFFTHESSLPSATIDSHAIPTQTSFESTNHDSASYESDYEPAGYESDYSSSYENYSSYDDYDYNPDYDATTDLDCSDIGYEHYVGSDDPHGLDGDGDGYACESY